MSTRPDPFNLIICGVGGQGNILISRLLGRILTRKGIFVSVGETFGAAQRGGNVFSTVRISRKRPYGPLLPEGDAHLILSLEPLETLRAIRRFGNPDVISLTNFHPIPPVDVLAQQAVYPDLDQLKEIIQALSKSCWYVDATKMAMELNAPIVTNVIMLGALLGLGMLPMNRDEVQDEIRETLPASKWDLNMKAFDMGLQTVQ
jgi:indolepyruvate ferredoxin oxidoreductase beta subunit